MLKIGVFGAGHLGKIHIRLLLELKEQFELVGFHDVDTQNAHAVSEQFGIPLFETAEELLAQVDCLDIVTPTFAHYDVALKGLKACKHLFIEKPITKTVEEANTLLKIATEANVKVQVGHVERFNPAFSQVKDKIERPMFIETHRLAQFNPRGTDVPVVLDLMIHDIDIVLSVVKSKVKNVHASGVAVVSDTPDITNARLEFENGCVANLTASRISIKNMRKSRFFQKNAYISVDFLEKKSELLHLEDIEGEGSPFDVVLELGEGKKNKKIVFEKPDISETNAIKAELLNFYDSITNDKTPTVSIEDGLEALKVAIQIMEKSQSFSLTH
ncbi:MAG TPA: Gfo/Idh/MocA family oxidoreductase [Crocinitomicaceae bacterium]|nr:Gfo/Idh/MocA family oxidoreductase [Crocinitomicaceae bacterium]